MARARGRLSSGPSVWIGLIRDVQNHLTFQWWHLLVRFFNSEVISTLEVIRNPYVQDELEFGSNIQNVTADVDYFDRLNQTGEIITPSWHHDNPPKVLGAQNLECITKTYSLETCDEFYEFESLPEMQIMELLTSEIILPTE